MSKGTYLFQWKLKKDLSCVGDQSFPLGVAKRICRAHLVPPKNIKKIKILKTILNKATQRDDWCVIFKGTKTLWNRLKGISKGLNPFGICSKGYGWCVGLKEAKSSWRRWCPYYIQFGQKPTPTMPIYAKFTMRSLELSALKIKF